jgi:predicted amidohydrolase YtcJ
MLKFSLEKRRSQRISPLASSLQRNIPFTIHDDTPVTPVNPLKLVWGAVNRKTRSGKVLGPEERVSILSALRAITTEAAWQNFEEQDKGSPEKNKLGDFVVLNENPLETAAENLADIKVVATAMGGEIVFSNDS